MDDEVVKNLRAVNFTGTYGEASTHPRFFEFLHMIADRAPHKVMILIETNGGLRDEVWWEEFSLILKERFSERSVGIFSIDGLDNETHQMYRRGVDFDKVMSNAKAFGKHCNVRWQMIEFEHNKHQFEDAKRMASELGWRFVKRRSRLRFIGGPDKSHMKVDKVRRDKWSKNEVHISVEDIKKKNSLKVDDDYYNTTEIICEWKKKNQISIDYTGRVWQCCYFSTFYHPEYFLNETDDVDSKIMVVTEREGLSWYENKYSVDWNLTTKRKLSEIMNHRFFKDDLPKSFGNRTDSTEYPRVSRCSKFCGEKTREFEK